MTGTEKANGHLEIPPNEELTSHGGLEARHFLDQKGDDVG